MKKWKRTLSGYVTGLGIGALCFGGLTYANTGMMTIAAHYANIKLLTNGTTINTAAQPFIFNHNVYVPVSTVAHGLGASVAWNNAKRQVELTANPPATIRRGNMDYAGLPVYNGTQTAYYRGYPYVSAFALATALNEPYYVNYAQRVAYIGRGPSTGMPIQAFYDVRDYGAYAMLHPQLAGPTYGWADGAPRIDGVPYPNANSLVWSSSTKGGSQVPGVEYNLQGHYSQLTGNFGLDDASDGKEQVQLTVSGNGKQLYQSPWMGLHQPAAPVSVDVSGVRLLTIGFSVKIGAKVYAMGQSMPAGYAVNIDFANVNVH